MSEESYTEDEFHFGDAVVCTGASKDNPHRTGFYVEIKRFTGVVNRGRWVRITDGKGNFWLTDPQYVIHDMEPDP